MSKLFCPIALLLLISGCVSLPGSESQPSSRYDLSGTDTSAEPCKNNQQVLSLGIVRVGAGLDKNRIARRDADSGEITYLKGVRWAESSADLLEQRMANDLECTGYTVITSHRRNLDHQQLSCEVRRFNLVAAQGSNHAEVSLSCLVSGPDQKEELAVSGSGQHRLSDWSADAAVSAINAAYLIAFEKISAALRDTIHL